MNRLKLYILLLTFTLVGCSDNSDVTPTRSATDGVASPVAPNMCTSPVTRVIDTGERSTAGAVMGVRGAFSDIAKIPGTTYPGIVYTDTGAVALKYTFWNGSAYKTEVIAGGLTTNFVRLVYLSTGKPLVFWSNGATAIYMAARSTASISEVGTWTVTAIDNVAAMTTRSVEASVSNLDQVAVFYINGATTSARIILCGSNCDTASNYTGMGVVGNVINATASASTNTSDVKWCNAGGGVNYPYVAFGGTVNSLIGRCTQATLANCLTPANWSTTAITDGTNATGANQMFAKLDIGSTADSAFNVVARRATGTEIRAYTQNAGGCSSGALAFGSTQRLIASGATLGNSYASLTRDASNRWHLVVNDSTTSLRYFNELTGTITAAWNTVSVIETTTIAAAGVTRGGMIVDDTGSQVLVTYGRTAAGTPTQTLANVVLATNDCPTSGTGCLTSTLASPSSATGMIWANSLVDTTGQITLPTAQIPNTISTAATSMSVPAVAYVDFSAGAATTGRLKYALRAGYSATDHWPSYDIASGLQPQSVALAFDHTNRPWVAFYDASSLRYYLATNNMTDGSGVWTTYQYPIANASAPTLPAANNVALAMSYSSGVAKPLMFVTNSGAATKVMRAAVFNPATEAFTLDTQLDTGVANFSAVSVDYNTSGVVVVAYYDTTNNAVKYNYSSNGGTTWGTAAAVSSALGGMGVQIKLNPVTSKPSIAYYDRSVNLLRYKYCSTAVASCTTSGNWSNLGLGVVESTAGISGLTAVGTDGLLQAALTFTATGQAWLAYPTGAGAATSADLMMSYVSEDTGVFTLSSILNAGAYSIATTPVAATPANFGVGGWMPSSVRTALGSLHTVYVGPGNFLQVTSCGD